MSKEKIKIDYLIKGIVAGITLETILIFIFIATIWGRFETSSAALLGISRFVVGLTVITLILYFYNLPKKNKI
jgi:hypothetical protein